MNPAVNLKGSKDGFDLFIEPDLSLENTLKEIESLLQSSLQADSNQQGRQIKLQIFTGNRLFTDLEKEKIQTLIEESQVFIVTDFHSDVIAVQDLPEVEEVEPNLRVIQNLRSGQSAESDGDLIMIGNVQPGASLKAKGSIFLMGEMRGRAHAGADGDESAVVVGRFNPSSQVIISDKIYMIDDEVTADSTLAAYISDLHVIEFTDLKHLKDIRPELNELS